MNEEDSLSAFLLEDLYSIPIIDVCFTSRVENALINAGITTVGELIEYTTSLGGNKNLLSIHGIGKVGFAEVEDYLKSIIAE